MALLMRYPARANTASSRMAYALRVKEKLKHVHNVAGKWARSGITLDEYDNGVDGASLEPGKTGAEPGVKYKLPQRIKNAFPYKAQLSRADWASFGEEWDMMRLSMRKDMSQLQQAMQREANFDADIDLDDLEATP